MEGVIDISRIPQNLTLIPGAGLLKSLARWSDL